MEFSICSKNGKIISRAEAFVSVFKVEFSYGFGVYENIRVRNGVPLFIADHIDRLMKSASAIGLEHKYKAEDIVGYCHKLIKEVGGGVYNPLLHKGEGRVRSRTDSINLKILLIGAAKASDANLFILPLAPLFPDKKLYSHGAKVISVNLERPFPNAKTLNMLPSYLAYKKAKEEGCYDALLVNNGGNITEGTRTNFFVIKNNTIIGAPEKEILCGVTRKYVLKVAEENGFEVKESNISLAKIGEYDGAFLTSTSGKIVPIRQIDNSTYSAITPEVKRLMRLFDSYLESV